MKLSKAERQALAAKSAKLRQEVAQLQREFGALSSEVDAFWRAHPADSLDEASARSILPKITRKVDVTQRVSHALRELAAAEADHMGSANVFTSGGIIGRSAKVRGINATYTTYITEAEAIARASSAEWGMVAAIAGEFETG